MNAYLFPLVADEINLPFYVNGVGGLLNQVPIERPNGYPDYHWLHCLRGAGRLYIQGREYMLQKNTGFLMHPGVPHEYFAVKEHFETRWVTFGGKGVPSLLQALEFGRFCFFTFSDSTLLDSLIADIFALAQSKDHAKGYGCSSKLYQLLLEIKSSQVDPVPYTKQRRVAAVTAYMEERYAENPTVEEMADAIGTSPQYLFRLFRSTLHMRPFHYLTLFRIQKAKELLLEERGLPVKDVAAEVGYKDASYFCSLFKKHEGLTPMEFRKMHVPVR
jgi:AraC family transcriptional regulator of arabinose operon